MPIEVAAYQLNLLLGMDVVPPAVFREEADVDWTHYPAGEPAARARRHTERGSGSGSVLGAALVGRAGQRAVRARDSSSGAHSGGGSEGDC